MATQRLAVWLLVGIALPQVCCQHWSYGLTPGGKRELDSIADTLRNVVEGLPHEDPPCGVVECAEESPFAKMYRMKGLLGSGADRENGHRTYQK